jgi:hypothetical protein
VHITRKHLGNKRACCLQVVDYTAVASALLEGQAYLHDLIHPRTDVSLEIANIYLNIATEAAAVASARGQGKP